MLGAALGGIPIQGTQTHVLRNNTSVISLSKDYHRNIKLYNAQQSIRDRKRLSKNFETNATRELVQYYLDELDHVSSKYANIGLTNISPILHKGKMYDTAELYMYVTLLIAIYLKVLQTFVYLRLSNNSNEIEDEIEHCYDKLEGLLRSVDYSVAPVVLSTAGALNCMSLRSQIDEAIDVYGADVPYTTQCIHNITTLVLLFANAKYHSHDLPSYPASDKDVINKVVDSLYDFRIGDTPRSMIAVRHHVDIMEQKRKDDKWHFDKFAGAALDLALDNGSVEAVNLYHQTQAGGSIAILPYALSRMSSTDSLTSREEFFRDIIPPEIVRPAPVFNPPEIVRPAPVFNPNELYDRYGNNDGHFDGMYANL